MVKYNKLPWKRGLPYEFYQKIIIMKSPIALYLRISQRHLKDLILPVKPHIQNLPEIIPITFLRHCFGRLYSRPSNKLSVDKNSIFPTSTPLYTGAFIVSSNVSSVLSFSFSSLLKGILMLSTATTGTESFFPLYTFTRPSSWFALKSS